MSWKTSFERFVKTGKKIDLWKGIEGSFLKGLSPVTRDALPVDVNIEKGWETLKATSWNRRRRKLLLSSTRWLVQLCPHQEGAPSFASLEDNGLTCITVSGRIPREMFGVLLWGAATGRIEVIVGAGGYASSSDETTKERLAQMILLYVVTRFGSPSRRTGFVCVGPEMMSPGGPEEAVMGEFESLAGMKSQKFDQGALGGGPRRSSRLLSNYDLNHLDGLRQPEEGSCGEKDTSRQWPRQLEVHVQKVVGEARFAPTTGSLRAMTKQAWEDHARSGHYPYRRDCLQCVLHGATGHRHKRIEHPSMFVLTTDISGPFKQEGLNANARGDKRKKAKMKHLLVGRFSIPKAYVTGAWDTVRDSREEVEYVDLGDFMKEMEGDQVPNEADEEDDDYVLSDGEECPPLPQELQPQETRIVRYDDDDEVMDRLDEEGKELLVDPEVVARVARKASEEEKPEEEVKPLPEDFKPPEKAFLKFAVPLPDVKGPTVMSAVQKIVLYLKDLNIPVLRFHSDRASQFTSKEMVQWFHKESIRVTTSVPGVPQGNGGAENAVKTVKQQARTMLGAARLGEEFWPLAVMAATAMDRAKVLSQVTKLAATFGTRVYVKRKKYADKRLPLRMEFEPRWREGIYMGLSDQVDEGHLVYVDGTFLHTKNVRPAKDLVDPGIPEAREPLLVEEADHQPARIRLREKTTIKALDTKQRDDWSENLNDPEAFAKELIYEEIDVDEEVIARLFEMLPKTRTTRNVNPEKEDGEDEKVAPMDWSAGAFVHGGVLGLKKGTKKFPYTTRVVNQFIASKLGNCAGELPTWTTFSLFGNILAGPHRDSHNFASSSSYLIPVSSFDGGGLWVEGLEEGKEVITKKGKNGYVVEFPIVNGEKGPIEFHPRKLHSTMLWKGFRLVVAAYTVRNFDRVSSADQDMLTDLGSNIPGNLAEPQKEVALKKLTGPDPDQAPPQGEQPNLMLRVDVTHLRMEPEEWYEWKGAMTRDANNMTEGLVEHWRAIAPMDNEPDTWIPSTIFQDLERDSVEEPDVLMVATDGSLLHLARVLAIHSVDLVGSYENGELEGERITVARTNNHILHKEQFILFWEVRRIVPMDSPRPLVQIPTNRNGPADPGDPRLPNRRNEPDQPEPRLATFKKIDEEPAVENDDKFFMEVDLEEDSHIQAKKANVQELYTENLEKLLSALKAPLQVVHTCDPREASQHLESWKPALKKEIKAMEEMKAIRRLRGKEAKEFRENPESVIVPSKLVYTAKPPSKETKEWFRRRVRAVACGNFEQERPEGFGDLYAAGASIDAVRGVLAEANYKKWSAATDDIKNAFLTAPLVEGDGKGRYAMEPPRAAVRAGLADDDELWVVDAAVYGFKKSPRWWTVFRNSVTKNATWTDDDGDVYHLEMAKTDLNLFKVWKEDVNSGKKAITGYVVFYVDDILAVGTPATLDGFFGWLNEHWETSGREDVLPGCQPVRFLGLELSINEEGEFCVSQQGYLQELLRLRQPNSYSKVPIAKDNAYIEEGNLEDPEPKAL